MSNVRVPQQLVPAMEGARVLWKLWTSDQVQEAYVRELNRSGDYVRLSKTPRKKDRGAWLEVAKVRVVDVLEEKVNFARLEAEAKAAEKAERDRFLSGKDDDEDDDGE